MALLVLLNPKILEISCRGQSAPWPPFFKCTLQHHASTPHISGKNEACGLFTNPFSVCRLELEAPWRSWLSTQGLGWWASLLLVSTPDLREPSADYPSGGIGTWEYSVGFLPICMSVCQVRC